MKYIGHITLSRFRIHDFGNHRGVNVVVFNITDLEKTVKNFGARKIQTQTVYPFKISNNLWNIYLSSKPKESADFNWFPEQNIVDIYDLWTCFTKKLKLNY